jgi:outer membrane protein OmpA-like peptidoglycan-associated protein
VATFLSSRETTEEETHWLSVADLMAALMMVFLFIAIAYMHAEQKRIKEIAVAYQENQKAIYEALNAEFSDDLANWDAEIDEDTLTFTFRSPDVLFPTGEIELSKKYQLILDSFFPRYISVLGNFKTSINEVRIEGHTSSEWNAFNTETEAYFKNMALSQGRTRSVLNYVFFLSPEEDKDWLKQNFAAVGLSSARVVRDEGSGLEDKEGSRRVSFRVITNAEFQIRKILEDVE